MRSMTLKDAVYHRRKQQHDVRNYFSFRDVKFQNIYDQEKAG